MVIVLVEEAEAQGQFSGGIGMGGGGSIRRGHCQVGVESGDSSAIIQEKPGVVLSVEGRNE